MPRYVLKALVHDAGDGRWKAEIPGIPVHPVLSDTRDEAVKAAQKAAQTFLREINSTGDGASNPGDYAVTVVLDVNPEEPAAMAFDLPPDLANELERAVQEEGWDKSDLARKALKKYLYDHRWEKMLRQNRKRARELDIYPEDVQRLIYEVRDENRRNAQNSP